MSGRPDPRPRPDPPSAPRDGCDVGPARPAGHAPTLLWLTGVPAAGKSTIAAGVSAILRDRGHLVVQLDGDELRRGLCRDLGFSPADREENLRRAREVALLMLGTGAIVVASFVSPFRADRDAVRTAAGSAFVEVHVDAPLAVVEARDPKGLYARVRRGELTGLTGVDAPYEPPSAPELHLLTAELTPEAAVGAVIELLERSGRIPAAPGRPH